MFLQVSVILFTGGGVVVSQHALQVVSQHALQVSRGVYPSIPCRFPSPHPRGSLMGLAKGGFPGPHPGGVQAHTQGDLQAHTWGVSQAHTQGVGVSRPTPRRGVFQHALRQTPLADGYCCRQFASYWNTFLFLIIHESPSLFYLY